MLCEDVDSQTKSESQVIFSNPSRDSEKGQGSERNYLFDGALDDRVNDEMCFQNFNILLEMKKWEFKLSDFFLGHQNS